MTPIQERTRSTLPVLVVAGLVLSLIPILYLHLTAIGRLSPVSAVVSDYVFVPGGTALLAVGSLSLAAASVALLLMLIRRGLPRSGPAAVLLGVWSAGLLIATAFPTDPASVPTSFSGVVHRYAGAAMFISLPLAGWLVSRGFLPSPAVHRLAVAAGFASFAFLLTHLTIGTDLVLLGLFERVLYALLYGLLFAMAAATREVTR
ncbi:DUF998 domain-containing protein [Amycolatopsis sp. GM8]|uniref:DUF998 domain-containing protein n=1 Tax=Amycolatopsis sp. GM8 TaxID=2896530 RepID=UPI001F3DA3E3|nr:DUF998 domain-containing protein [Amycolatopsis sp. GM8]